MEHVISEVESYGARYEWVDIVFDVYNKSSLKSGTMSKWGQWIRRRVTGSSKTPCNRQSFCSDASNRTELFHFLAEKICEAETTSTVILNKGADTIGNTRKSECCVPMFS